MNGAMPLGILDETVDEWILQQKNVLAQGSGFATDAFLRPY